MRSRILLLIVFTIIQESFSQDTRAFKSLKAEADRFYEDEQYHLAIQYYRELADWNARDADVCYRLADCYTKTFNYPEAEAYYLKVYFLAPTQYPLSLYYYALMLKFNANFDESILYFKDFISQHQLSADLKEYVEQAIVDMAGSETAKEELGAGDAGTKFIPLNINTPFNDFAPAVRDSLSLVITSGRISSNRQSIDERYGEAFTDNFYFEKQGSGWVDRTKQLFSITNTAYNDGSGCFNRKRDKYYFSVCGRDGPQCRIFVTYFRNNKWNEPIELNENINYKSFESKHPAIANGGDTLIFSTNRNGGFGKFDLWMSVDAGDDQWGPPMNLGSSVNTKLNELSPSLTPFQNVLFFSSDGHEGYGGVDLYMAKSLSTGDTILYNLGIPFNANRDDCFISFSDHELYWSTNRNGGAGGFDVTAVKIPSALAFISKLSLKKRNARRDMSLKSKAEGEQRLDLQASRLEEKIDYNKLSYEKKKVVDQMIRNKRNNIRNELGKIDVTLDPVEFEALERIAEERYREMQQRSSGYLAAVKPPANSQQDLSVTGVLADSLTGNRIPSGRVLLVDSIGEVLKITRTNDEGKFKFSDVPAQQELYLRTDDVAEKGDRNPQVIGLSVASAVEQQLVHFENIYFDFDHYRLRPEAVRVLDELASHLISNPEVQLEIYAFADDRGTNDYNLQLTRKRGQSVVDYLTQLGVDQTGLAIIAKGKQAPKEIDVDLQRQYNRRVEFYLNGNASVFKENARTFILKKKADWSMVAQATGIPAAELKALNGTSEEQLKAFQPIRIPSKVKVAPDLFFTAL